MNDKRQKIRHHLDDILPHVSKPARYFAGEIGLRKKRWDDAKARIVIGFPDVYEIAVGNLGHRLIQEILNSKDEFLCERVYSVWPDMEDQLRKREVPLYSLESFNPVRDFDVLGVSLPHELSFTNLLQLIDLSGLSLHAENRGFPIVICGGPAVFNPEPVAEFVDAFLLGDGEEAVLVMADEIAGRRDEIDNARGNIVEEIRIKNEILDLWGGAGGQKPIPGVYVPGHFRIDRDERGRITGIKNIAGGPDLIHKALVTDLEKVPWIKEPPIPHMQGVASRVTIEPIRGCTHGCRFCNAGMVYRPYRERPVGQLIEQAEQLLEYTGHQEQSFLALSATDYPGLKDFIQGMRNKERDFHLKISLPSNRVSRLEPELLELLRSNRKGGITIAPEAATPRMRAVINKEVTDDEIDSAITNLLEKGWSLIKLYFMIGLPTETDADVLAIIDLVGRIVGLGRRLKKEGRTDVGKLKIKASVSTFVPKAHTPFQWAPMETMVETDRKQKLLTELRRIKGVDFSSHDIGASWVEGIMARGDRRLGQAIEIAYRNGARFDAWSDQMDLGAWRGAFDESGIVPEEYLGGRDIDEILPWDHLSCGVDKDWLKKDWLRALEETMIPDCNESKCLSCGMHTIYQDCRPQRI